MPAVPRLAAYGLISTLLAGAVVGSAIHTRANFFAAAVSVGRSTGSLLVLANFVISIAIHIGVGFKRMFFGELRPIEYEHMFERLWIFLTESLLALTIFRGKFTITLGLLYGMLVFLKCFHWITADRVDYLDQIPPPGPPRNFHIRILIVTTLLTIMDVALFAYAAESIVLHGVSAMVLFASEFAILLAAVAGTWARYGVAVMDLRRAQGRADAPPWEQKSMYLFYIDLAVDFSKLFIYLIFFTVILLNFGLPLHILRDVYMTLRSFLARGADLVRYRRATRNMDELYPDATAEELDRQGDRTCIICREEMIARGQEPAQAEEGEQGGEDTEPRELNTEGPNETPKKLSCGHIFHFHCLRSWLERQQSCPTCRRDVFQTQPQPRPTPNMDANRDAALAAVAQQAGLNRAEFEEYFRMPPVNGDAPMPPPAAMPEPGAVPGGAAPEHPRAASAPPAPAHNPADAEIQRSIWGAPIVPGRFHAPALGAAPRWPEAMSRTHTPIAAGPSAPASGIASGTTTPFFSQAPPVFTLPGQRHGEQIPESAVPDAHGVRREEQTEEVIVEAGNETESDNDDNVPLAVSREASREAAAAAALRRLGMSSSGAGPTREEKGKAPVRDAPPPPALAPIPVDDFEAQPTHRAVLTPVGFGRGTSMPVPLATRAELPRTPEAARAALDARLAALRGVDEVVWGLVGELSRLKSAWEVEDGVGVAGASPGAAASAQAPAQPVEGEGRVEES